VELISENRVIMKKLAPEERVKNFSEVELGYSEEEARREARRCLTCHIGLCIGCKLCADVCPNAVISVVTAYNEEEQRFVRDYHIDIDRCLFCGYCAEACPTNCLHLSKIYELSEYDKKEFDYDMEKLKLHHKAKAGESK